MLLLGATGAVANLQQTSWGLKDPDSYLQSRLVCEQKLVDLRWSFQHWPAHNRHPKPTHNPTASAAQIRAAVLRNLKQEVYLQQQKSWYFSAAVVQAEWQRIQAASQMPKRLQQYMAALGHDEQQILACLVRPALVAQHFSAVGDPDALLGLDWRQLQRHPIQQGSTLPAPRIPSPRTRHTTIWDGNHMIIWGGYWQDFFDQYALRSGALYDPVLDQWQFTSSANAPEGRFQHSAVWTGQEMIVWGGLNDFVHGELNSGGRYNPTTGMWQATASGISEPRYLHTAVWSGTEMIIWGGYLPSGQGDGQAYDPSSNQWRDLSLLNAPTPNAGHAAIWTGSEMLLWGGGNARYKPDLDQWTAITGVNAPAGHAYPHMVWTGSFMVVWGGRLSSTTGIDTGGIYVASHDAWISTSQDQALSGRYAAAHTWTGSELFLWGGVGDGQLMSDGSLFNPNNNSWHAVAADNAPPPSQGLSAVWTGERVVVWGAAIRDGQSYDPSTDQWHDMYGNFIFDADFE